MKTKTTIAMVMLAGAAAGFAQDKGPSSSVDAYVTPSLAGVRTTSILTVGDAPAGGSFRLTGIPDGMGGFDNGDGTFTLLVNHEFGPTAGIARTHGGTGAYVSKWIIDSATLEVVAGEDQIKRVFPWIIGTGYVESFDYQFNRLCSGDLPAPSALYDRASGLGTQERIFFSGEETRPPFSPDHGRAFAHIVSGPDAGITYELPALGQMSHENVLPSPFEQAKTIVIPMDDADASTAPGDAPSELYVYVGRKQAEGRDIERAGLTNGTLYGVRVVRADGVVVTEESNEFGFGDATTGFIGEARFEMVDLGDLTDKTGIELQTMSIERDITRWQRIEDGAWDIRPSRANDFYWVTTASISTNSRMFLNRFDDITNPQAGGVIRIVLDGSEGQVMMDNIGIDGFGNIVIQEDPGSAARLAKVWNYNVDTDTLTELAAHDARWFEGGAAEFITTNEESSGAFDASALLGAGWWLVNVQAHASAGDPELVEQGQLLAMFNPLSACVADFDGDGALNIFDFLAFQNAFALGESVADIDGDGELTVFDFLAFQNAFAAGCVFN